MDSKFKLKKMIQERAFFTSKTHSIIRSGQKQVSWVFDFGALLLDGDFCHEIAKLFWDTYCHDDDVQLVAVELTGVPLMSALLYEGYLRKKNVNGLIARKSSKKYGMAKRVEGEIRLNIKTIIIDDLINSGMSIEASILCLLDNKVQAKEVFSILSYGTSSYHRILKKYKLVSKQVFLLSDFDMIPQEEPLDDGPVNSYLASWTFDQNLPWNKSVIFCKSSPVCDDERVYFGTDSNQFFCLEIATGKIVWKKILPFKGFLKGIWSTPVLDETHVYFGSYDGGFYCLDKVSGDLVWENNNSDFIGSSPYLDAPNKRLFLGLEHAARASKGSVAAFDQDSGNLLWEHKTHLHVHSSPAYSPRWGLVFCGSNDSDILALDASTGVLKWRAPLPGVVKMGLAVSPCENLIVAGSLDGRIYILETQTGNIVSSYKTEKGILATPTFITKDIVVVGSCDNGIYIYNIAKDCLITKIQTGGRILGQALVAKGKIFVPNNAGVIYEIDQETFDVTGFFQLPERVPNRVAYCEKQQLFIAHTCDDRVFAFKRES